MPNAAPETRSRIITMIHKEGPQFLNPPRHGAPHAPLLNRRVLSAGPAAVLCTKVLHAADAEPRSLVLPQADAVQVTPRNVSATPLPQPASGVENPATSLTRSAWRATPVFSNRRLRWVLMVVTATPRAAATSGTPPTSTMASSTRSSVGVNLYISPITAGGANASRVALRMNNAA